MPKIEFYNIYVFDESTETIYVPIRNTSKGVEYFFISPGSNYNGHYVDIYRKRDWDSLYLADRSYGHDIMKKYTLSQLNMFIIEEVFSKLEWNNDE